MRLAAACALLLAVLAAQAWVVPARAAEVFEGRGYMLHDARRPGAGAAAPVVLVLHGGGGTGAQMRLASGFDAVARSMGAVVLYPDAPGRRWNDGRWAALGEDALAARDDTGHLLRLVADTRARLGLRAGPLFFFGHSNGGGMAMALACAAPGQVRAIAVIATKELREAPCATPAPVAALFIHATADRLAPHDGQRSRAQAARMGAIRSSDETHARWAARNRCTGPGAPGAARVLPRSGLRLSAQEARGCAAPLRREIIEGGGHALPGAPEAGGPALRRLLGPFIPDYSAAAAAAAFWGRL